MTELLDITHYTYNLVAIPTLLTSLAIFLLGLITLIRERGTMVSGLFFLLTLTVSIWLFSASVIYSSVDAETALQWARIEHIGIHLIPSALFHFAVAVMRTYRRYRGWVWLSWFISLSLAVAGLVGDGLLSGVYHYPWGFFPRYSWRNLPFLCFFFIALLLSLLQYWREYRQTRLGKTHQRRARAFLIAFAIGYLGSIDYLPAYGIPLYPFGYVPVLAFLLLAARVIWQYRLVDITPAFAANPIIATMSDALLVFDQEGVVRLVNRAASELFGYTARELTNRPLSERLEGLLTPEQFTRFMDGRPVHNQETRFQLRSGEQRTLNISASVLRDQSDQPVGLVCVIRDITERKQSEERIRREAARAEALLRVAARLNAQLNLDAVLQAVCEETSRAMGVPLATVSLYDERQGLFRLAAGYGLPREYLARVNPAPRIHPPDGRPIEPITVISDIQQVAELDNRALYATLDLRTTVRAALLREGQLVGRLNIVTIGAERTFTEDELALLRGLADQAAQAIANARLFDQAQRRLSQVQALRAIDTAITNSQDLRLTLKLVLEQITEQLGVDAAAVLLLNEQQQQLEYGAGLGFQTDLLQNVSLPLPQGAAGQAATEERTIAILDLSAARSQFHRYGLVEKEGFVSYYGVPLIAKGRVKGVLEIFTRTPLAAESEWVEWLETLSGQAAIAVDNATLFDETRRQATRLTALNATVAAAAAATDLSDLLDIALRHALRAMDVEMGAIWLAEWRILHGLRTTLDLSSQQLTEVTGLNVQAPAVVDDWSNVADGSPLADSKSSLLRHDIQATLTVPVMAESNRLGGLSLAAARPRSWTSEEIRLAEAIGQQLGAAAERIRLLARTQVQARQMQQIMDTVPEGLLLLDRGYRVVSANPAAAAHLALLTGRAAAEFSEGMRGTPLERLGDCTIQELVAERPASSLAREVIVRKPDYHVFEVIARSLEAGAEGEGWVLVVREVTAEREVEERIQQQERLAAVGQLAAGIAHDFNNIMAVIVLYTQMIQRTTKLSEKDQQRLQTIYRQATHATNLIHQILDFSRRSVMERSPMDLLPLLKELVKLWERTLPENITLTLTYDRNEYVVNADPTRLQQAMMNLVVNARDAMPEGGSLQFSAFQMLLEPGQRPPVPEMTPGEWVCLTVTDAGAGIDPDVLPRIFDPFFTTKAPGKGTGLGLAQVYGIVRQHDGHIRVDSQVGQGTTFSVYLSLLTMPRPAFELPELPQTATGGDATILLVENDPITREAVQDILQTLGYHILAASDGQLALELFAEEADEIDLVLSDMVMPEMSGEQLYQCLRNERPDLKMIIMTGYPLADGGRRLLEQGIVSWIYKPFSTEQIAEKVRAAVESGAS